MDNRKSKSKNGLLNKMEFFFLILFMLTLCNAGLYAADMSVPALVNYQGTLTDAGGNALADGSYDIEFRIWSKSSALASGDELIWGIKYSNIQLVKGQFNVILGAGGGEPVKDFQNPALEPKEEYIESAFTEPKRYLGIRIVKDPDGDVQSPTEISPRQRILSSPYAIQAERAMHGVPAGTILPFGGSAVPTGFLLCDGKLISRITYTALFEAIGTAWGSGDGSTTFNLPDLRGLFLRGVDGNSDRDPDKTKRFVSNSGGNTDNTVGSIQSDAFQGHKHGKGGVNSTASTGGQLDVLITLYSGETPTISAHPIEDNNGMPRISSETRPKNAYVNYIIKY